MDDEQCRMARAALQIGVRDLAAAAEVSPTTITRLERGEALYPRTVEAIRAVLEEAGVEFTDGDKPGVRLRPRALPPYDPQAVLTLARSLGRGNPGRDMDARRTLRKILVDPSSGLSVEVLEEVRRALEHQDHIRPSPR